MIKKLLLKLLLYFIVPIIVIIMLFKVNIYLGIFGTIAYFVTAILINLTLLYSFKGRIEYKEGNLEEAVKWYKKATESKKAGADVIIIYGFILFKMGKTEEAEKIFLSVIQNSKSSDEKNMAKSNLSLILWKKGELDKAISTLKEVILEYKTSSIYGSLGYLVIEKGNLDEALEINLEAYDYNCDNTVIQDNLAHLYHLRGELDKAGEIFVKLIKNKPHFPEAYFDYGQYLEDCGKAKEAVEMYQKALSCQFNYNSTVTREIVQECYEKVSDKLAESRNT